MENMIFSHSILFTDDDDTSREVMKMIFGTLGVDVETAANGEQAVEMVGKKHYTIVILDVEMPVMNGIDACKKIREIDPSSIIVMLTGKVLTDDEMSVVKEHANGYFTKPVKLDLFFTRLSELVREYYFSKMGNFPIKSDFYTDSHVA